MDAFSLALSIGTTSPSNKNIIKTAFTVGLFHFFMPMIGFIIGSFFKTKITLGINYLTSILFLLLAFEIYKNKDNDEKEELLNNINIILISLSVSIDSLTVGVALGLNNEFIVPASITFSIISSIFTYIGLVLGKKLENKYKKTATIIGIILLFLISIKYLINV